jgi:hypothetical protein
MPSGTLIIYGNVRGKAKKKPCNIKIVEKMYEKLYDFREKT